MTTDSVPLVMGTAEQFRALRSTLVDLHYDEASICARAGVRSIFEFRTKSEHRQTGIELNDALDALTHLMMDGETMHRSHLRAMLAAQHIEPLETMGVLGAVPNQPDLYYATVFLYPVASLYIASDRGMGIDKSDITSEREIVYPAITTNTRRFLDSLPETPCESLLDLCSGSGIAAFVGAVRYAQSCRATWRSGACSSPSSIGGSRHRKCNLPAGRSLSAGCRSDVRPHRGSSAVRAVRGAGGVIPRRRRGWRAGAARRH